MFLALSAACKTGQAPIAHAHVQVQLQASPPAAPKVDAAAVLGDDADPPGFDGLDTPAVALEGAPRRSPSLVCTIDTSGLPSLGEGQLPKRWGFDLKEKKLGGYSLVVRGMFLAEAEVNGCKAFTYKSGFAPAELYRGEAATAGLGCHLPKTSTEADLRALDFDDWTADTVGYVEEDASYDPVNGLAAARRARRGYATALWPSVLYAIVARSEKKNELVILGPPTSWVSAPGPISLQTNPNTGSFTVVRLPLDGERGESVSMQMRASAVREFHNGPPTVLPIPRRAVPDEAPPVEEPPAVGVTIDVLDGRVITRVVELKKDKYLRQRFAPFEDEKIGKLEPLRGRCRPLPRRE
jgi:hypothetical protein